MNEKRGFPECSHPKKDCVACHDGHCIALYNTEFRNGKPCPFHMDAETRNQRIAECRERAISRGFIIRNVAN